MKLGFAALLIVYLLAIPLGLLAAWGRNRPFDQGARLIAVLGMGIPNFFLAVLLIQLFAVKLGWLPPARHRRASSISPCRRWSSRWSRWRSTCA